MSGCHVRWLGLTAFRTVLRRKQVGGYNSSNPTETLSRGQPVVIGHRNGGWRSWPPAAHRTASRWADVRASTWVRTTFGSLAARDLNVFLRCAATQAGGLQHTHTPNADALQCAVELATSQPFAECHVSSGWTPLHGRSFSGTAAE